MQLFGNSSFKILDILHLISLDDLKIDNDQEIIDIKDLFTSKKNDICFFHSKKYKNFAKNTKASFCLTTEILSNFDDPSAILEALPKSVSTPELNIKLEEGEQHKIIQQLQEEALFSDALNIIKIDGLRVEYANGFGLMRASNTHL